jgi:hypothetical protein
MWATSEHQLGIVAARPVGAKSLSLAARTGKLKKCSFGFVELIIARVARSNFRVLCLYCPQEFRRTG